MGCGASAEVKSVCVDEAGTKGDSNKQEQLPLIEVASRKQLDTTPAATVNVIGSGFASQQAFIDAHEPLNVVYTQLQSRINALFVGIMAAASGLLTLSADTTTSLASGVVGAIPFVGSLLSAAVDFYAEQVKANQVGQLATARVDCALSRKLLTPLVFLFSVYKLV